MKPIGLIDSHIHLHHEAYQHDVDDVIKAAEKQGLQHMVTIACDFEEYPNALALANRYQNISSTIGVHPHNADKVGEFETEDLIEKTRNDKTIALGETGLDYYYQNSAKEKQIISFQKHIEAARITKLPLIIHARSADEDIADILEKEMKQGEFKFLMHCFSSGRKLAEAMINIGGYFSFSGIITFKNADELREIVHIIPEDRILIETDGPYLAPVPHRGKRNEPQFLKHTAEELAKLRGWSFEKTAQITFENFYRLFSKINPEFKS